MSANFRCRQGFVIKRHFIDPAVEPIARGIPNPAAANVEGIAGRSVIRGGRAARRRKIAIHVDAQISAVADGSDVVPDIYTAGVSSSNGTAARCPNLQIAAVDQAKLDGVVLAPKTHFRRAGPQTEP